MSDYAWLGNGAVIALRRWKYRVLRFRDYGRDLNRRAKVEQELLDCARGTKPLPDRAQCREWAARLGVPNKKGPGI